MATQWDHDVDVLVKTELYLCQLFEKNSEWC